MSSKNGDKSRFHRERKQKLARRKRNRELLKGTGAEKKSTPVRKPIQPEAVSA